MAFSLSAIQTSFATYLTAATQTATAKAAVVALGQFPLFPLEINSNGDYATTANAQAAWLTNYGTANTTYQNAVASQRSAELAVIATIVAGTTSATQPQFGANQWYEHSDSEHWFGYAANSVSPIDGLHYLVVETILPTQPFANSIA